MTPLAYQLFKHLNDPTAVYRSSSEYGSDKETENRLLASAQYFEVTGISDTIRHLLNAALHPDDAEDGYSDEVFCNMVGSKFCLPADVTCIELMDRDYNGGGIIRNAFFIEKSPITDSEYLCWLLIKQTLAYIGRFDINDGILRILGINQRLVDAGVYGGKSRNYGENTLLYCLSVPLVAVLAININKGIKTKKHATHKTVIRMARRKGVEVRAASEGWTEVTLSITNSRSDSAEHDTELSEALHRVYHFCRGHRRKLKSGKEVSVVGHWRGDALVGVKHKNYNVTP